MTATDAEFERTIGIAEAALERIKALRHAATPHNFEVWFTYASGINPSLNQIINDLIGRNGTITEAQVEELYLKHFSAAHIGERIDKVGTQIAGEIEQVMSMIEASIGTADSYSKSLAGATEEISNDQDREQVRAIVESLVSATREVESKNQVMQQRLKDSRQEIRELQENLEVVRTESLTDPLTTLSNRKFFDDAIERMLKGAETSGETFSVILTDIDHFKKFNDTYGHLTGNQVLRLVAVSLKHNVKAQDIAARYGRGPHPPRGAEQGTPAPLDRRNARTRYHLARRRAVAQGRRRFLAARACRQLPLRGEGCRPQLRDCGKHARGRPDQGSLG